MNAPSVTPRDYQTEAVSTLFDYLTRFGGNPIVAMPTATGKSVVIAEFLRWVAHYAPRARSLVLTHVKELIQQNHNKIGQVFPAHNAKIYSAGIGKKEVGTTITFGGVASVKNVVHIFEWIDFILIDECHLLSERDEGMYQGIIKALKEVNPGLRVIGFTATPYRMKQGMLTDNGIFTDVAVDYTTPSHFGRFIAEGYLCPVVPKPTNTVIDISGVKLLAGDYNLKQLDAVVDDYSTMYRALQEVCQFGQDRRRWLIFNTSVENAKHTAELLNAFGIPTKAVYHGMEDSDRAQYLKDFHDYKLRAISNFGILTTGYDEPGIDLIGMLRATKSVPLWVQMLGRGMRPAPWEGKRNCLVLDFAGNCAQLGPVDDPNIPGRPRGIGGGVMPLKTCDGCGCYNHISVRFCVMCGQEFPIEEKITTTASTTNLMQEPQHVEIVDVMHVQYYKHVRRDNGNVTLKCVYHTSLTGMVSEYIGIEAKSRRAYDWWSQRSPDFMPETTEQAITVLSHCRTPRRLHVWKKKGELPEIIRVEWD